MYGVCEVYASTQVPCLVKISFQLSSALNREGCNFGPREQINQITAWIDGSNVYGRYDIHYQVTARMPITVSEFTVTTTKEGN